MRWSNVYGQVEHPTAHVFVGWAQSTTSAQNVSPLMVHQTTLQSCGSPGEGPLFADSADCGKIPAAFRSPANA